MCLFSELPVKYLGWSMLRFILFGTLAYWASFDRNSRCTAEKGQSCYGVMTPPSHPGPTKIKYGLMETQKN